MKSMGMPKEVIVRSALATLAALLVLAAPGARGELLEATWTGVIRTADTGDGLFGAWTQIDPNDIVVGRVVSGTIRIDTDLAPARADISIPPFFEIYEWSSGVDQVIDSGPRWLTLAVFVNGNRFAPASEPRPPGVRTACVESPRPAACDDPSANQRIGRQRASFPAPGFPQSSFGALDDWDTLFDGIYHDREIGVGKAFAASVPFSDQLPDPSEDFASVPPSAFPEFSAAIKVGGSEDGFEVDQLLLSNFAVVVLTPEELLQQLIDSVPSFGLPRGTETSLLANLENALAKVVAGEDRSAIQMLRAFNQSVSAQRDDLGAAVADALTDGATEVILLLAGSPAAGPLEGLVATILGFGLPRGTETSLIANVDNALAQVMVGNDRSAINVLRAFCRSVEAQRDQMIDTGQADTLVEGANEAILGIDGSAATCPVS